MRAHCGERSATSEEDSTEEFMKDRFGGSDRFSAEAKTSSDKLKKTTIPDSHIHH
ncbi:MAG: hypothetical protein Tsb009_13340 [Planctomycetaceae bacterium]